MRKICAVLEKTYVSCQCDIDMLHWHKNDDTARLGLRWFFANIALRTAVFEFSLENSVTGSFGAYNYCEYCRFLLQNWFWYDIIIQLHDIIWL